MKKRTAVAILLGVALATSLPVAAGAVSQAGGLPALAAKVAALQHVVAGLQTALTAVQNQLNALQGGQTSLQNQISALATAETTLANQVAALEAATAFASMNADGTLNYSKDVDPSPGITGKVANLTGAYQVAFTRDVSKCAAVANVHPGLGIIVPAFALVTRTSNTQVGVTIFKFDGTALNDAFELAVLC